MAGAGKMMRWVMGALWAVASSSIYPECSKDPLKGFKGGSSDTAHIHF